MIQGHRQGRESPQSSHGPSIRLGSHTGPQASSIRWGLTPPPSDLLLLQVPPQLPPDSDYSWLPMLSPLDLGPTWSPMPPPSDPQDFHGPLSYHHHTQMEKGHQTLATLGPQFPQLHRGLPHDLDSQRQGSQSHSGCLGWGHSVTTEVTATREARACASKWRCRGQFRPRQEEEEQNTMKTRRNLKCWESVCTRPWSWLHRAQGQQAPLQSLRSSQNPGQGSEQVAGESETWEKGASSHCPQPTCVAPNVPLCQVYQPSSLDCPPQQLLGW